MRRSITNILSRDPLDVSISQGSQPEFLYMVDSDSFYKYLPFPAISSRPEVFSKKGVFESFRKFTGKQLCQGLFFNKIAGLRLQLYYKRDSVTGAFFVNFVKYLRTHFFIEHRPGCFYQALSGCLCNMRHVNSTLLTKNACLSTCSRFLSCI